MAVLTRAKELSKAVFVVTQGAPKKFRFSLASRLQDLSLEVVGRLYRANEIFTDPAALNSKSDAMKNRAEIKDKSFLAGSVMLVTAILTTCGKTFCIGCVYKGQVLAPT